ncbi:MAG: ribonuclease HI family protein [Promethearchaeota archaeon]|nr:MAG: ribonuclease HI family protein [Candidatus Lokiarchaeota archaeon]
MDKDIILNIYTDGAARGNPGPAASAFLIVSGNEIIHQNVDYIGTATNNTAEYNAIINALTTAQKVHKGRIQIYTDSKLAVNQITNKWKINYPHLLNLVKQIHRLMKKFKNVEISHVTRDHPYIQKCDQLCNEQLDVETRT